MNRVFAQLQNIIEVQPGYWRMRLSAPAIAQGARAGHFVHMLPHEATGLTPSFDPLLRRAFSILSSDGQEEIEILFRVGGKGTRLLSKLSEGDTVDLLGPLGVTFVPASEDAILVGGGVGVPPMVMLATQERREGRGENLQMILGARTAQDIICEDDFALAGVPFHIATDDGSVGQQGRVTDVLEPILKSRADASAQETIVYACGPLPMLRAVVSMCEFYNVRCQVSLEESMPCGVGVCNGCVVPVREAKDDFGAYRRICVEGPVAWSHEIDWARLAH
jgi:dihydroorotate dehydrogenase electron transfer subunit